MSYIALEIIFKLDWNIPFYVKYGKREKTKGINALKPNNTINHWMVSINKWKENEVLDQTVQNINFPRCQNELQCQKWPHQLLPLKDRAFDSEQNWSFWAAQEPRLCVCRGEGSWGGGAPFRAALICSVQAPGSLCRENHCGPMKLDAIRSVTGGCAAQALPCGADRHLDDFWREGCCMGRVLKWELSLDRHLKL